MFSNLRSNGLILSKSNKLVPALLAPLIYIFISISFKGIIDSGGLGIGTWSSLSSSGVNCSIRYFELMWEEGYLLKMLFLLWYMFSSLVFWEGIVLSVLNGCKSFETGFLDKGVLFLVCDKTFAPVKIGLYIAVCFIILGCWTNLVFDY